MLQTAPNGGFPALARRRPSVDELSDLLGRDEPTLPVIAAGVVLRAPDGSILFLKRSPDEKNFANHWALPGGGIEEDESPDVAARRECFEETGHAIDGDLDPVTEVVTGTGKGRFATFENRVPERFEPTFKDGEHVDFVWALPTEAPQPIHPGVGDLLTSKYGAGEKKHATDSALRLALDKDSVRTIIEDANGDVWRMVIASANLSKATVNPYLGREIPNAEALGLEADKVYQLLRDPDEMRKAASTANMVQLLRKHTPVSANDPQLWDTVGTTGSHAEFNDPYLQNSLSIWTREAMDDLEDESKKELSCGYAYRAEMTPGIFAGMRYDGVMRDLKFNHVAMVKDGRAGPDVVIGDSNEEIAMATEDSKELAKRWAALSSRQISIGALCAYMRPRLAKAHLALDAKPLGIMGKVFEGVTGKNFKEQKPVIAKRLQELAKPMLAKDATLDQVGQVLDMLDKHEVEGGDASVSPEQHNAMEAAAHGASNLDIPKKVGEEFVSKDAPSEEFSTFMKGKGATDEEVKKAWDMFPKATAAATDAEEESEEEKKKKEEAMKAEDARKAADNTKAMDQAIGAAVTASEKRLRQSFAEIEQAKSEIKPWIGELPSTMSFDSAEQVRRHALKTLGVENHATMHADALSAVLNAQPKPNTGSSDPRPAPLALDAGAVSDFAKRFPDAGRIGT